MMEGIKIVKTSKNVLFYLEQKINLDQNKYEDVIFSMICLKSGFYQVKGKNMYKFKD